MVTVSMTCSAEYTVRAVTRAVLSADTLLLTVLVLSVHGMYELAIGTMSASRYAVQGHSQYTASRPTYTASQVTIHGTGGHISRS